MAMMILPIMRSWKLLEAVQNQDEGIPMPQLIRTSGIGASRQLYVEIMDGEDGDDY